ncbi:MAG: LPS assembly protein LptD, partial [Pseudomonadota bacterium]
IDEQLQITAAQAERVSERYNQMYRAAATSCTVCEDGRAPLWQIRARRVIHDKEARQIYFENAQFRVRGVPLFYLPRMRVPDPSVDRATGFLIPSYESNSDLGVGIKIPYFFALRDDRDLRVTPYIADNTTTLELRYRQAFVNGDIEFDGAVSRDDLRPSETRSYLFGQGFFRLRRGYVLNFDVEVTSDDDYLLDYGYSNKDRLDSQVLLSRTQRDEYTAASLINYQTLRGGESNSTIPSIVGDLLYERRLFLPSLPGELRLTANAHNHIRYSDEDVLGRDVQRINTEARWLHGFGLPGGVRAETQLGLAGDIFNITQDSTTNQNQQQITPFTSLALRYPLQRVDTKGATQFLEPIVQLAWTGGSELDIPNEESTLVDFDGGNLLSLSRFPAPDRRERGSVLAYGANWSRFALNGAEHALTFGQVLRSEENSAFTPSSGLEDTESDFLVAGQLKTPSGWSLTGRTLFDDAFSVTKAEVVGGFSSGRGALFGSYIWLIEDEAESRDLDTSELFLFGTYQIANAWRANADWRYDFVEDRYSNAGLGMIYTNECVQFDVSVRRRFNTSSTDDATTTFGFSLSLLGFSATRGTETLSRTCG